jgi:hypothetical protein
LQRKETQSDDALSASRDVALGLSPGDRVQCIGPGYLEVLVSDGTKKITSVQKWFTIPALPAASPNPKEDTLIVSELTKYGISGATRGIAVGSRILWPSESSAALPENFVIRWMPVPQKIVISLMSEAKDFTIWGPAEVDGSAGTLKSDSVSTALAAYKKKPGSLGLVLTLTLANSSDWEEVHFSLLNGRQEQELNGQLDFWAKHSDGLALHLGRGYSFSRYKLYPEAAEEYESALEVAPGSVYLLQDAIQADRLAGRVSRVKELQSSLASR